MYHDGLSLCHRELFLVSAPRRNHENLLQRSDQAQLVHLASCRKLKYLLCGDLC